MRVVGKFDRINGVGLWKMKWARVELLAEGGLNEKKATEVTPLQNEWIGVVKRLELEKVFKFATEEWEFEQIHQLNYRTFVEEIPQHEVSDSLRRVDKFHDENTYLICLEGQSLIGMLAVRGRRPFSLDQKLPDLDVFLPARRNSFEIRLLAIKKGHRGMRGGKILSGLLALLWNFGVEQGYDLGIISATTRQLNLYRHMGFVPFGPLVGSGNAQFQPMYATLEAFELSAGRFLGKSG